MKSSLAASCFVVASLLAPVAVYANHEARANDARDSDQAHPKTWVKDSAITTKVKAKLAAEKASSLVKIKVDTDDAGAVMLSGRANTQADADKAVEIARETEGVTSVESNIRIGKSKAKARRTSYDETDERHADRSHPKTWVKDSVITTKIKAKLAGEKASSLVKVKVDTDSAGVVMLSGRANSQDAVDRAEALARDTEGVTSVTNNIKVRADD